MVASFKELTAFFKEVGAADVGHTNKSYLAHCIGVQNDMKKWGGRGDVPGGAFSFDVRHRAFPGFCLAYSAPR